MVPALYITAKKLFVIGYEGLLNVFWQIHLDTIFVCYLVKSIQNSSLFQGSMEVCCVHVSTFEPMSFSFLL